MAPSDPTQNGSETAKIDFSAYDLLPEVPKQLLIGGKWEDAASNKTYPVIDPRTEEEVCRVAEGWAEDVDRAVRAARTAFDQGPWPRMSGAARGRLMHRLADLIEQNTDKLAALESLDNGKPVAVALVADIPLVASCLRYYAGWADKIQGKTIPADTWVDGSQMFVYTMREPLGVVAQIIPWNFPMLMAAWKVGPALACGNCIVLKPAEQTPLTALMLGKLALEAGMPPGVLNVVTGFGPDAGAPLVSHPLVDKVAFTGSTEVGRHVMVNAAEHVKDITLELGGKSPLIVWKDADLDLAVDLAHNALMFNHGQCCAAGSRLYVHEDIYDAFVEKSAEMARARRVGDPFDAQVEQGPQVDQEQFDKIMSYIQSGKDQGARLLAGGDRHGTKGYFVMPTVFADVKDDMKIAREEIFGPVQSILKYSTIEEVIARANDTMYGLASGIIARDIGVVNRLSRAIKAGTVWVNCYNVYDAAVPFGGYRMSGIGRDKGEEALHHYTATKAVYQKLDGEQAWY